MEPIENLEHAQEVLADWKRKQKAIQAATTRIHKKHALGSNDAKKEISKAEKQIAKKLEKSKEIHKVNSITSS